VPTRAIHLSKSDQSDRSDRSDASESPLPTAPSLILHPHQVQRTFDRRTGELNGSLSGSARFTLLLTDDEQLAIIDSSHGRVAIYTSPMSPILASPDFTGFKEGMLQFYSWLITAALSLVALILVFWRRTRGASIPFALGSMLVFVISGLALASFASAMHYHGESIWQAGDNIWRDMVVFFAPLVVALVAFCVGLRSRKVDAPKPNMKETNSAKDVSP